MYPMAFSFCRQFAISSEAGLAGSSLDKSLKDLLSTKATATLNTRYRPRKRRKTTRVVVQAPPPPQPEAEVAATQEGPSGSLPRARATPRRLHPHRLWTCQPLEPDHPDAANDATIASLHYAFLINLIANRCWSQSFFTWLPPYHYAMCFLPTCEELEDARKIWAMVSQAILKLEQCVAQTPADWSARALLRDIATHHWPITREFLCLGEACGYRPNYKAFREQAFSCFAGPCTTKSSMESGFNHVKDSGRQTKGKRMNVWTHWSYLSANPYLSSPDGEGVATVKFNGRFAVDLTLAQNVLSTQVWDTKGAQMPEQTPTREDLSQKWRPAGFLASRVSAAAVACALESTRKSWMGDLTDLSWSEVV